MQTKQQQRQTIMNTYKISTLIIAFVLLLSVEAKAQQDPNFTLYNFNMNIINPAFAGIGERPQLNMVYRNQFIGIPDAPKTVAFAYSRPLAKNLGIGVSFINDQVFVLRQTDFAVDLSYGINLNEATRLYFGLKLGGATTNIDLTRASTPGTDPLFSQNQTFFNPHVGAGINIQNEKFFVSISTPNFLRGERYEKQGNFPRAAVNKPHFYLGGGYNFTLSNTLVLTPRFMMRTVEGAPSSYDVGASMDIGEKLLAGVNYRVDEMTAIYGLYQVLDNLRFGMAYDITTSDVNLVNDNGSLELILNYRF